MTEQAKDRIYQLAGNALFWKGMQMIGVKGIFLVRLFILTRLLLPEDFGLLAIAVTAIGFMLSITNLGMIPALVQGTDISEKHYQAAWTVGITRAVAITGFVILLAPIIAGIFAEPRAIIIIQVLAIRPVLEAAASIKVANLTRDLAFRPLALIRLVEALTNTLISIPLAFFYGVWALVIGALAGSAAYLVMSYLMAPHRPRLVFDQRAIRPLIRFGRWIFLTSLITLAGSYVLRVVISRQLGTAELGLYFLAAQLAFLPAEAASEVVGSVAFPLFARLQTNIKQATAAFQSILKGIMAILFPICTLIIVLAPTLVQEILGVRWAGSAPVIQILTLSSLIGVFGEATVPVFHGFGQPYRVTILEIIQSSLLIISVWSLTSLYGLAGAALAWLPAIIVSQIASALFIYSILDHPFVRLATPMLAIVVATGAGVSMAISLNHLLPGLLGLISGSILAVMIIGGLLWIFDRRFSLGLTTDLIRTYPQIAKLFKINQPEAGRNYS